MLSVACVSIIVYSADGPRVIIPRRNLKPSGTDVLWHCSLNLCSSPVNLWLLFLRYYAISRDIMRAAFASALQSRDELQYSDAVTRCVIVRQPIPQLSAIIVSYDTTGNALPTQHGVLGTRDT